MKAYKTVRGSAVKHVKAALPALGALVQTTWVKAASRVTVRRLEHS